MEKYVYEPTVLDERQQFVAMRNELIDSMEYNMTRKQLLLLRYMIKQIKPLDKPEQMYSISIKAFCKIIGVAASGANYREIKKTFEYIDNQTKWIETKDAIERVRWLNRLRIKPNSGLIEYSFHEAIAPYLFDLINSDGNYTKYLYEDAVVMETEYGIRLYELVKEHFNAKHRIVNVPLDRLMALLGGSNYKTFKDFRRNILDRAIEEVNRYSTIKLTGKGKPKKGERIFSYVQFVIGDAAEECETYEYWDRLEQRNIALGGKGFSF